MNQPDLNLEMTEAEFVQRFVVHMVTTAGSTFSEGSSIEDYAKDAAPTY